MWTSPHVRRYNSPRRYTVPLALNERERGHGEVEERISGVQVKEMG